MRSTGIAPLKIDTLGKRGFLGRSFFPDYIVSWHQKTNTFHMRQGHVVALVEFIEPLNRPRKLQLSGLLPHSRYILRKPLETLNFVELLTPENSEETVLYAMEMATNYLRRIEFLAWGNPSESYLRQIWADYTNTPFPTSILNQTKAPFPMRQRSLPDEKPK
jgi:hypothetical protein